MKYNSMKYRLKAELIVTCPNHHGDENLVITKEEVLKSLLETRNGSGYAVGSDNPEKYTAHCNIVKAEFIEDKEGLKTKNMEDLQQLVAAAQDDPDAIIVTSDTKTEFKTTKEIINGAHCPLNLNIIPNHMGINLCSVKGISWAKQDDGQLINLTIHFLPDNESKNTKVMEFSKFLESNGSSWSEFEAQAKAFSAKCGSEIISELNSDISAYAFLVQAFTWDDSKRGFSFWKELSSKLFGKKWGELMTTPSQ